VRVTYTFSIPRTPDTEEWIRNMISTLEVEFRDAYEDPDIWSDYEWDVDENGAWFKYTATTGNTHELEIIVNDENINITYTYEGSRYGLMGFGIYEIHVDPVPKAVKISGVSDTPLSPVELWVRLRGFERVEGVELRRRAWESLVGSTVYVSVGGRIIEGRIAEYETSARDLMLLPWEQVLRDGGIVPAVYPLGAGRPRKREEVIRGVQRELEAYAEIYRLLSRKSAQKEGAV